MLFVERCISYITLAAVNDYKENNGLGNTGAWAGAVGDETWGLLQGEDWQGEVNTDDSVYIDSSGVTITAGNRSGKTIDSSGNLVQNKSSGKKKVMARGSQGKIDALSVAKGFSTAANVVAAAAGFAAAKGAFQIGLGIGLIAAGLGGISMYATYRAYRNDEITRSQMSGMNYLTGTGVALNIIGGIGGKILAKPLALIGGSYGVATELAGSVFP